MIFQRPLWKREKSLLRSIRKIGWSWDDWGRGVGTAAGKPAVYNGSVRIPELRAGGGIHRGEAGSQARVFGREVSELAGKDCVFATNTSGLSITAIAEAVKGPERFAGMHWFNPSHIVPLVEVIQGEKTAPETADFLYDLALRIGKKPVRVNKDAKGFLANRLRWPFCGRRCTSWRAALALRKMWWPA